MKIKGICKKTEVAVELHEGFLKLAQACRGSRLKTYRLIKKDILSTDDNEIARETAKIFQDMNISSKNILVNIPRALAMVKAVRLPSINDKEITDIVKIESMKQMPYTDEDIIAGHRVIEKFKDGYSDVLIVIIHAVVVKRILNIFELAGLDIKQIALSSEALWAWFLSEKKDFGTDAGANIALINIDFGFVDIDIIEKENLVFTRGLLCGSAGFDCIDRIADEIRETVLTCQRKRKIDRLFLCGAENTIERLDDLLKDSLNIPLQKIPQGEFSFLALKGLLASRKDIKVNMIPQAVLEHNRKRTLKKNIVKLSIFFFCIGMVVLGITVKKIADKSRYLSFLDKQLKIIEQDVFEGNKIERRLDIIKNNSRETFPAIDILAEFYHLTPEAVTIDLLDYNKGHSLALRGSASSLNTFIEFVAIMERSLYFEDVKVRYTIEKPVKDKMTMDFEIVSAISAVER